MSSVIFLNFKDIKAIEKLPFEDAVHAAATFYINAGIHVVPLEPNSKKLPTGGGINYLSATIKQSTIDKWFGEGGKYRGFNIGIATGLSGGVMALDLDAKPVAGTTGLKEIERITSKEGPLPAGPRQKTPSGGFHHLYLWQDNATSSSSKVANGIDTRGGTADRCTGHIVAFPSKINGKTYEWEEGGEVPPMPDWLSVSLGEPWRDKKPEAVEKIEVPTHQINRMLSVISPDSLSYDDWVKVGMALKSVAGDDGFELWDEWSSDGSRRKNNECRVRWKSFNEDGLVGFGTLLFMAKEAGWRPLPGDVTAGNTNAELEEQVLQMNKNYALLRIGKNMMIATFSNNAGQVKVGFLSMQSFYVMAATDKVVMQTQRGFSERPMADIWLAAPNRRQYFDMGIYPNDDEPNGTLNMWNGWGVVASQYGKCDLYLDHMLNIICDGAEHIYEWLLDWMADCVQNSRDIKGTCIVLKGVEGCGKGAWADQFGQLFGKHYTHLIDAERLTSKFNNMTSDSVVIFADEVLWPGDRKSANVLKGMVSERKVTRESKGVDSIEVDNLSHIIIASNDDWIVPAGPQSRRWLVLNVSSKVASHKPYFDALFKEMENGGKEALLHLLKTRVITSNLRLAPHTAGLTDQRRLSHRHDSLLNFLMEAVIKGRFDTIDVTAKVGDDIKWASVVNKFELFNEYRNWARDTRVAIFDVLSATVFMGKMEGYGFIDDGDNFKVPTKERLSMMVDVANGTRKNEIR